MALATNGLENGIPVKWTYANASARTSDTSVTSDDLGKWAWQTDNNTFWLLTATTPTWVQIGGGGGGGGSLQVKDEGGSALPAHPYLNFVGGKVAAYEDIPNDAIVVQIDANVIIPSSAVAGQVTYFVDIDQIGGHTGFTYDDATGQLSVGYLELPAITAPSAPASGFVRFYVDVADGHVKFKKNGGTVIDLG